MSYQSWSVVFNEQPSAAKWNILGTNDASFNDGTGIANFSTSTTAISNPYKFFVYRNAAQNTTGAAYAKINYDTELTDTNSNFDSTTNYRYTIPVTGFYNFHAQTACTADTRILMSLFKNGTEWIRGTDIYAGASSYAQTANVSAHAVALTAADYIEVKVFTDNTKALGVGASPIINYFSGFLVSRT